MSTLTIFNPQAAPSEVPELWRRAVLGDQPARHELLRRITPQRRG